MRPTVITAIGLFLTVAVGAVAKTPPDRRFTPKSVNAAGKWNISAQRAGDSVRFVVTIKLKEDEVSKALQTGDLAIRKQGTDVCFCEIFGVRRTDQRHIQFIFVVHKDYLAHSRFRYQRSLQRGTQAGYIVLGDFVKKGQDSRQAG